MKINFNIVEAINLGTVNGLTKLFKEADDFYDSLYPPTSNHPAFESDFEKKESCLFLAFSGEGLIGSSGAISYYPEWTELKRMYVKPAFRQAGIGEELYRSVEQWCMHRGHKCLKLETGIYQPEAQRLYLRNGFSYCDPFKPYLPDPNSVFMTKEIGN